MNSRGCSAAEPPGQAPPLFNREAVVLSWRCLIGRTTFVVDHMTPFLPEVKNLRLFMEKPFGLQITEAQLESRICVNRP